ncbi:acyltransferase domain-containing protein [Labedaea rhizosphaerae]|uniref:Malonyl CoA-acyl carrier protein transacylase n=1 Tax=Labedaea rhizosphaerae TaxID=598644 RepID=A0A4R6RWP1_LABRH|nr:acyltransferase domain-containing protein [Labedaea rhizosphaerae]TDP90576.1 malonyl CoA-acyl carrier protein transacylase [Labedaea rhizosphaerae]
MGTRPIALLLPGQGAQHPGMGVELYGAEPAFTAAMDELFTLMGPEGARLRADWLADEPQVPLDDASRAQPLLFALGYALGRALAERGIRPAVLLGHSVGELAAAALAGVFDAPAAAQIMLARTAAMATAPPGGLLALAATPAELEPWFDAGAHSDGMGIGALNAPRQTVLAGPEPRLTIMAKALRDSGISGRRVGSRQPFHCPAVADAAVLFESGFAGLSLRPPRLPIWSTRTAKPVAPHEAVTATFWARQLAAPVLFWPALDGLLGTGEFTLVEAGPGKGLSMLARRHPAVRGGRSEVVPLLPAGAAGTADTFHAAIAQLTN